jgi:hypothetical protein
MGNGFQTIIETPENNTASLGANKEENGMKKGFKKKKRILMKQEGKTVRESEQGHV